jgi:hypothetical protein
LLACSFAGSTVTLSGPRHAWSQSTPGPAATPQPLAAPADEARLTQPQLEQLLAPIALYPDPLLAQVLMASG